jgi:hypothetical protein
MGRRKVIPAIEVPREVRAASIALEATAHRYDLTVRREPGRFASRGEAQLALRRAARAYADAVARWESTMEMVPDAGDE